MPRKKKSAKPNPLQNASTQDDVKLFKLPAELRNRIYGLVLDGNKDPYTRKKRFGAIGLLLTCKPIYAETLQIYFNKTKFCFENITRLRSWLRTIGPVSRRHVRHIVMTQKSGGPLTTLKSVPKGASILRMAEVLLCKIEHELQAKDVVLDCRDLELEWLLFSGPSYWQQQQHYFVWQIKEDGRKVLVKR